jgi:EAL domain-containing protein (putative c-di-GMP-specific phosphodiesterase class I)/FixJ family two-component response regulator
MDTQALADGSLRVLIIDDDETCILLLVQMLKQLSVHDVKPANGWDAALQLVESHQFDVIICDLRMPGRDGIEVLRLLAQRGTQAGLVLMSASDARVMESARQLASHRGLNVLGCLIKPLVSRKLEKMLTKARTLRRPKSSWPKAQPVLATELAAAITSGELLLHFQPQVSLTDGRCLGSEALVRWQHASRGLLLPDAFIPMAEEENLIEPLTDWVVGAAITQARRWRDQGLPFDVSVNLSARSLKHLDLPDRIAESLQRVGLEPRNLTLEITESGLHDDIEALLDIVTRLRLKGFPLSIDDFGTGYANLTQLRRLPFTELKLDRSFVSGSTLANEAGAVVRSSVELAKRLRLQTVGEGIESIFDWQLLQRLGVDRAQGYYIARPMPATDFPGWVARWKAQSHPAFTEAVHSIPASM